MTLSTGYTPPGVYITPGVTGSISLVGINSTVLCLVGPGVGYLINTETVSFAAGDAVVLGKAGVDLTNVVVSGTVLVGGVSTPTTFFTGGSGPLDYLLDTDATSGLTTITRMSNGKILPTSAVTVTYHYTDPMYYAVNAFTDYASVVNMYGPAFDPTGLVATPLSPLSLAAKFAFGNGATLIYTVALNATGTTPPSMSAQYAAAYAATLTGPASYAINLVVPLNPLAVDTASTQTALEDLHQHLQAAVAEGLPRIGIFGAATGYTGESPDILATGVRDARVVLCWPQSFTYYNPDTAATSNLDGFYFAAAAAGALANQAINRGLTRTQIRGFSGIPAAVAAGMPLITRDLWSSSGVSVAEMDRSGRLVIRHGVSTDMSGVQTREISIVREQDALFALVNQSLDQAGLIGDPITANTALNVKGIIAGALETALTTAIIQGYDSLLVRQQVSPGGDPSVIECTFVYYPTFPINYITVVMTMNLSTGTTTITTV